jgi:hypothetical protein
VINRGVHKWTLYVANYKGVCLSRCKNEHFTLNAKLDNPVSKTNRNRKLFVCSALLESTMSKTNDKVLGLKPHQFVHILDYVSRLKKGKAHVFSFAFAVYARVLNFNVKMCRFVENVLEMLVEVLVYMVPCICVIFQPIFTVIFNELQRYHLVPIFF